LRQAKKASASFLKKRSKKLLLNGAALAAAGKAPRLVMPANAGMHDLSADPHRAAGAATKMDGFAPLAMKGGTEPDKTNVSLLGQKRPFLRPGRVFQSAARGAGQGRAQRARAAGCLDAHRARRDHRSSRA
jgi:hypothetical protein